MKKRRKAFTAVEVTMVAAVIAILALIILPLFQKRADKARLAAAQDDLQGLAKAEILTNADTDQYFRLQDLDNTKLYPGNVDDADIAVPYGNWYRLFNTNERDTLSRRWEGPYIAIQSFKSMYMSDLQGSTFNEPNTQGATPIVTFATDDITDDKYPIDPWGGPYIFFAPSESLYDRPYSNAVIYSMGPDGLPGDGTGGITADTLVRDSTNASDLGNGDDLKFVF